jgi:hypothetical protein
VGIDEDVPQGAAEAARVGKQSAVHWAWASSRIAWGRLEVE